MSNELSGEKESVDNVARKIEFLEHQKYLMKDVKAQCCLIQLKVTEQGTHTFELPQNIRRQTGKLKTRRDLWTTLFMGNQMAKYYFNFCLLPTSINL